MKSQKIFDVEFSSPHFSRLKTEISLSVGSQTAQSGDLGIVEP